MGIFVFFVAFDETIPKMIAAASENTYILRKIRFSVFFSFFILRWGFLTNVTRKKVPRANKSKNKIFGQEPWIEKICKNN